MRTGATLAHQKFSESRIGKASFSPPTNRVRNRLHAPQTKPFSKYRLCGRPRSRRRLGTQWNGPTFRARRIDADIDDFGLGDAMSFAPALRLHVDMHRDRGAADL